LFIFFIICLSSRFANLIIRNFQLRELTEEEKWQIEHAKLHEQHRGHDKVRTYDFQLNVEFSGTD